MKFIIFLTLVTVNSHITLHLLFKSDVIDVSTVSANDCYFRGHSVALCLYSSYSNRCTLDSEYANHYHSLFWISIALYFCAYSTLKLCDTHKFCDLDNEMVHILPRHTYREVIDMSTQNPISDNWKEKHILFI